ncbi:MAG: hypothetical protein ACJLS3_03230 [Erythrobacter sp.]
MENLGSLNGGQFGVLRNEGDAPSGGHGLQNIHQQFNRARGKLKGLVMVGVAHAQRQGPLAVGKAGQKLA